MAPSRSLQALVGVRCVPEATGFGAPHAGDDAIGSKVALGERERSAAAAAAVVGGAGSVGSDVLLCSPAAANDLPTKSIGDTFLDSCAWTSPRGPCRHYVR